MPDCAGLCAKWAEMLARRRARGEALAPSTSVLDGWRGWRDGGIAPLRASAEEGYFVEACRGHLKGVARRKPWNAVSSAVEDWASPALDCYAAQDGYWRATPLLASLLPADPSADA